MSRPSIDQLDARSGPIPHFDRHLNVLKNGYLSFFMERYVFPPLPGPCSSALQDTDRSIEELKALYKRIKQLDASLDIGMEYSQARGAWREVRESLDRGTYRLLARIPSDVGTEIQSRTAYCSAINADVVRPLRDLRDTQERTRQRIYEDMKESSSVYNECAENQLPRAQKLYRRKCQEAEESRIAPTIPMPPNTQPTHPQSAMPTPMFSPTQEMFSPPPSYTNLSAEANHSGNNPGQGGKSSPPTSNASTTGLASTPSRGEDPGRARSPPPVSSSIAGPRGAVQDLAQHGKKGLNQLKSFLDSKRDGGGSLREGSERGNIALRNVRAKREAEEADKEYRKVVYKLETLRRWRGNVIRAGFTSLETFMVDLSTELIKALNRYTDTLLATSTTNSQLAHQSQSVIAQVDPDREVLAAHQLIPEHISRLLPKRTLYQNYTYGDSSDLIFGFSLLDYAAARNLEEGGVPGLVAKAVRAIDERGLDSEGIYRISGRQAIVQDLIHRIEKDEAQFEFEKTTDVYCIGSMLKRYLRELPEPLFRFPLAERIQHSAGRNDHVKNGFMVLRGRLRRLPGVHQATVRVLVEHLARVAARAPKNKMDPRNLAIVFGSVVFGEDEIPRGSNDLLSLGSMKDTVLEDMITFAPLVFGEREAEDSSPSSSTIFNSVNPERQSSATTVKPDHSTDKDTGTEELPEYYASASSTSLAPEKGGSVSGHLAKPSLSDAHEVAAHDEHEPAKEKVKENDLARDAPLPAEPVGETPLKIEYGSSHTLVRHPTVTGDTDFSPRLPDIDFAPRLPARPGKSIHPASRAAALNPLGSETEATPPALPPRSSSMSEPTNEPPALPPRKLGTGAPSLDVRLPSPLPDMTFPRTPPSPIRNPIEGETPTPNTPIKTAPSVTTTPIKATMSGRLSESPVTPLRPPMERSETDSPGTAEFTTPTSSPMGIRTTPSRTAMSEGSKDESPRKSGEAKRT
ncbi:Rho GTPase-activating protein gacY [Ceratobasidium sp. AG-Ba]|nr:Rho GTPase-activating protein gacY [Ceratobasidium sp. AG-Ba]QRW14836.1 Rho GTPase-activating protein gacY [Ceratobasidium sp. AG-Ba]